MRIFLTGYFTAFIFLCHAQNRYTDTSTTLVSYWKQGELKKYEIKEESTTFTNDTLTDSKTEMDTIHLFVKEETTKSYIIEWEYLGHSSSDSDDVVTKKVTEKLNRKFGNLKLVYSTSETGAFNQIENWEKLSKAFGYAFDEAIKSEKENKELVKIFKQLKELYLTKQGVENMFNKYVNTFHYLYGLEFFKSDPYYFETTLPNVFGGEPFPAKLAIKLDSVNTADEISYLSINQSIDKEKAKSNITEILEKISGRKMEKDFLANDELFMINDKMRYKISIPEGWILKYEFLRTIKIDNIEKITKISINLIN